MWQWRLAVGYWLLAIGDWRLVIGGWLNPKKIAPQNCEAMKVINFKNLFQAEFLAQNLAIAHYFGHVHAYSQTAHIKVNYLLLLAIGGNA